MDLKLFLEETCRTTECPTVPEQRWQIVRNKGAVSTIIITLLPLYSKISPLRLLHNRNKVKKINHVSKHFYFYASVKLQNISDLGIKILLDRKLQIASYGETSG